MSQTPLQQHLRLGGAAQREDQREADRAPVGAQPPLPVHGEAREDRHAQELGQRHHLQERHRAVRQPHSHHSRWDSKCSFENSSR